jgi:methionine-rich copper-binding protein CopC
MTAVLAASVTSPVAAHGDLILELGAERAQPGGSIEVRGDLGAGESFEVALISQTDGSRRPIATIPATEEGHFQSVVTLPTDVVAGDYVVEVSADLVVVQAPLTIAGSPQDGEGGGGPEQEDGLLKALPSGFGSGANGAAVGPASSGRPASVEPGASPVRAGRSPLVDVAIIGSALIIGLGLIAAVARRSGRVAS